MLINTFQVLEPAALAALNGGEVIPELPPVVAIGPLRFPPREYRLGSLDSTSNRIGR